MTRSFTIFLLLLLVIPCGLIQAQASDSTLVRIRVDIDSVDLTIDNQTYRTDSYGNPVSAGNWFILRVTSGEHRLSVDAFAAGRRDTTVVLEVGTVFTWDIIFRAEDPSITGPKGNVTITCDPDSATLFVGRKNTGIILGRSVFDISPGSHLFEVHKEGFEAIGENLEVPEGFTNVRAILAFARPAPKTPEEYGMELLPEAPLRLEEEAETIRKRFNGMAESFAVVPLAQGILAKLIIGGEAQREANILVASGVVLTGGSYLLGKIFTSRKKRQIRAYNEATTRENQQASDHNSRVRRETQRLNAEQVKQWRAENEGRGVLEIEPSD